jgi:hypothetical protein
VGVAQGETYPTFSLWHWRETWTWGKSFSNRVKSLPAFSSTANTGLQA